MNDTSEAVYPFATTVTPAEVRWEMDWSGVKPDGTRQHPNKPEKEMQFETEQALALLLINEVVFLNQFWWEKEWPENARRKTSVSVNCNDVFAWGCADAENMDYRDLESLYDMWIKDPSWGPAVWCIIRRRELPQKPVAESIAKRGIWDLNALKNEHGLRANHYDGVSGIMAGRQYRVYAAWAASKLMKIRPFDAQWWAGWKDYTQENPEWNSAEWKAEDDRLINEFKDKNGFTS